jgi:hypothetical protein
MAFFIAVPPGSLPCFIEKKPPASAEPVGYPCATNNMMVLFSALKIS